MKVAPVDSIFVRMKLQVPLRMPAILCRRSPARPSWMPTMAGMPPATEAPNSSRRPIFRARSSSSESDSEMSSLFAVTTDFPARSARRTQSPAGSRPPISSTTTSASEEKISSTFAVHRMSTGNPAIFFLSILRLKMCVRRSGLSLSLHKIFATERPTVPKPMRAIFSLLPACRAALCDADFARRAPDERDLATDGEPRILRFVSWILPESSRRRDIPATHGIKQRTARLLFRVEIHLPDGRSDARPIVRLDLYPVGAGLELIDRDFESERKNSAAFFTEDRRVDILPAHDGFAALHIHDDVGHPNGRRSGRCETGIVELGVKSDGVGSLEVVAGGRNDFHVFQEQWHAIGKQVSLKRAAQAGGGLNLVAESESAESKRFAVVGIDCERSFVLAETLAPR